MDKVCDDCMWFNHHQSVDGYRNFSRCSLKNIVIGEGKKACDHWDCFPEKEPMERKCINCNNSKNSGAGKMFCNVRKCETPAWYHGCDNFKKKPEEPEPIKINKSGGVCANCVYMKRVVEYGHDDSEKEYYICSEEYPESNEVEPEDYCRNSNFEHRNPVSFFPECVHRQLGERPSELVSEIMMKLQSGLEELDSTEKCCGDCGHLEKHFHYCSISKNSHTVDCNACDNFYQKKEAIMEENKVEQVEEKKEEKQQEKDKGSTVSLPLTEHRLTTLLRELKEAGVKHFNIAGGLIVGSF